MTYSTTQERQHIAAVNAGERCSDGRFERMEALNLSPLADALKALLTQAQDVLESRVASVDEKRLAERLLDAHGSAEDCWTILEAVGE